jgi:two-component system CheB/CheR fusion protein
LVELIRRFTAMPVYEVTDGLKVVVNSVYIIPPNHDMAFLNGRLQLLQPLERRGLRLPIDFFFRSLASDQHERAIGIILSGNGSDGTLGLRAIKGEGGMLMVQAPETSECSSMPSSALATGLIDYELPAVEMGAQLIAYTSHAFVKGGLTGSAVTSKMESELNKVFVLLRIHTGHDFSFYKPNTIHRRIERRMAVHQIDTLTNYVNFLQQSPNETDALFHDLLIGVTNFFRDPEAFKSLEEKIIPKLFLDKTAGSPIRVWVPACSTGEEAYSIAILLVEHMEALKQNYPIQVFATDIDNLAVANARVGLYPASIATDLSPERLARFFTLESDGSSYRINKGIRDLLVFSEQNVIKDPPFSKLDLISCRNLLIYLGTPLQEKLIPLFHYALKPGGMLFLGTSEGLGSWGDLYDIIDRKAKIFQTRVDLQAVQRAASISFSLPLEGMMVAFPRAVSKLSMPIPKSLRQLTEQALLQQVVAMGALVNAQGDILYLHGRAGTFLEPATGEAGIQNIFKMAREGLRRDLMAGLHLAARTKETVTNVGLRVKTNDHFTTINLTIRPVKGGAETNQDAPHYLVILEEIPAKHALVEAAGELKIASSIEPEAELSLQMLKEELRVKNDSLQSAHEELQSTTEKLKSSNEEMQSVNEELQSTNEELETAKEEMQSVNEELSTVNAELQTKVSDLSRVNNDMNNLLAGTGIATVFVDHQRRILRFTPTATAIINLIRGDIGRPVSHLLSNLVGYNQLADDVQAVLDTLVSKELEVRTLNGRSYLMRINPYRTQENVIEGAVLSFFDITEMVEVRKKLQVADAQNRLAVVVRDSHDAITVRDLQGNITAWNPSAVRMYGWSEAEALKLHISNRVPVNQQASELDKLNDLILGKILIPYRTMRLTKSGAVVNISMIATALRDEKGNLYAISTTERLVVGGGTNDT